MNASKFSILVLAHEIAAGSVGLSPLNAALILWHGASSSVEDHSLQARPPGAMENCEIMLLSWNNKITNIHAFRRVLQDLHPYQSVSQPVDCASGLSKAL